MASSLATIAVDHIGCSLCGAPQGNPCVIHRGQGKGQPTRTHAARLRPLENAWRIGFTEGMQQQTQLIRTRLAAEQVFSHDQLVRITRAGY